MICPPHTQPAAQAQNLVADAWRELAQQQWTLHLITDPKEQDRWNKLIRKHHYLKEHRLVGESLCYVIKQGEQWIALLGWSSAAFHVGPRDAWIGWTDTQRQACRHLVACNARFLILPGPARCPNLASQILSLNLQCLSHDWEQRYGHPLLLVETYVDPERFEGTCYRAANWTQIGVTKGFGRARLHFYQLHQNPKAIFLYPLLPKAKQILAAPVLPPAWAPYGRATDPQQFPLSNRQTKSLLQALAPLSDPRRRRGWRHRRVASMIAIAAAAMIAGNNHLIDIGAFAQSLNQNQLRALGASRCRQSRRYVAPSETTIRRVLQRLDPTQLDTLINDWLRSHLKDLQISGLAVDGKCVRTAGKINGQPLQLFGALDSQSRLFCRQITIPAKRNEISSLKELLAGVDLRGALMTADALNTQKSTAVHIVENKQADYLLVVKANQPKLFDRLTRLAKRPEGVFFPSGVHAEPRPRSP